MKNNILNSIKIYLPVFLAVVALNFCRAQEEINIQNIINVLGQTKPIPVSLEGFTGEAEEVLKFDLYVQGFTFVAPEAAQYRISGSSAGNVQGQLTDAISRQAEIFAQLQWSQPAAAGARVRGRHCFGHHGEKGNRADQDRVQGAGAGRRR